MILWRVFCAVVISGFLFSSCKKDDPVPKDTPPRLKFFFEATVNSKALVPETEWYSNFSGDSFTVTKFDYYISNLRFKRNNGGYYTPPPSYHLIRHVEGFVSFELSNLEEGDYTAIEFLIGVDSLRNVSGAQEGDLDPANNMFWDWSTGYIFFKLEGRFNTKTQPTKADYGIHIGGFEAKNNCLRSYSGNLPALLRLKNNSTSKLYLKVKVDEVFQNPLNIDFDYYYANAATIAGPVATNYSDMFFPYKVEN